MRCGAPAEPAAPPPFVKASSSRRAPLPPPPPSSLPPASGNGFPSGRVAGGTPRLCLFPQPRGNEQHDRQDAGVHEDQTHDPPHPPAERRPQQSHREGRRCDRREDEEGDGGTSKESTRT